MRLLSVRGNIEFLQKWKEITVGQNCHTVEMQNSVGAVKGLGSSNDDILQGNSTSNKFVTSGKPNKE